MRNRQHSYTHTYTCRRRLSAYTRTLYNPLSCRSQRPQLCLHLFMHYINQRSIYVCMSVHVHVCVCVRVFISLRKFLNKQICQYFVYCLFSIRYVLLPAFCSSFSQYCANQCEQWNFCSNKQLNWLLTKGNKGEHKGTQRGPQKCI